MKVGATAGQFMTVGQWPVEHDTGNENDTAEESSGDEHGKNWRRHPVLADSEGCFQAIHSFS